MPFLRERSGRWSPVKIVAFGLGAAGARSPISRQPMISVLAPSPRPSTRPATGRCGFLLITLAITPAQRILDYPRIVLARRTLGVASAAYATLHLSLYVLDQHFDLFKVASEIVLRIYLLIGA